MDTTTTMIRSLYNCWLQRDSFVSASLCQNNHLPWFSFHACYTITAMPSSFFFFFFLPSLTVCCCYCVQMRRSRHATTQQQFILIKFNIIHLFLSSLLLYFIYYNFICTIFLWLFLQQYCRAWWWYCLWRSNEVQTAVITFSWCWSWHGNGGAN